MSNNHVNQIIAHQHDFDNEEILAYYVTFLKTLSLRLNPNVVYFFHNEVCERQPAEYCSGWSKG